MDSAIEFYDASSSTMRFVMAMSGAYVVYLIILGAQLFLPNDKTLPVGHQNLWSVTQLVRSQWLSGLFGGVDVQLKMESMQPSGSVAVRGISKFMIKLLSDEEGPAPDTFVTSSCCDGTLAMAHCAKELGCKSLVILAETERENEMVSVLRKEYDAEVVFKGLTRGDAVEYAQSAASDSPKTAYIPMSDHPVMALCQQSIVTEIAAQCRTPADCIVFPVEGDGNLLLGMMTGLSYIRWARTTKLVAVQTMKSALRYGTIKNSFRCRPKGEGVDLGHRPYGSRAVSMLADFKNMDNAVECFVVKDEDTNNMATMFALKEKVMINAEAAATVTAVMRNKEFFGKFKNIVLVISSGNMAHFDEELLRKGQRDGSIDQNGLICADSKEEDTQQTLTEDTTLDEEESDFYDSDLEEM